MKRSRAAKPVSVLASTEDIKAELAREVQHRNSLAADLDDAVLAAEETPPYRANLIATDKVIAALEHKLAEAEHVDAERRSATIRAMAHSIASESTRQHAALITALLPPPNPAELREYTQ